MTEWCSWGRSPRPGPASAPYYAAYIILVCRSNRPIAQWKVMPCSCLKAGRWLYMWRSQLHQSRTPTLFDICRHRGWGPQGVVICDFSHADLESYRVNAFHFPPFFTYIYFYAHAPYTLALEACILPCAERFLSVGFGPDARRQL